MGRVVRNQKLVNLHKVYFDQLTLIGLCDMPLALVHSGGHWCSCLEHFLWTMVITFRTFWIIFVFCGAFWSLWSSFANKVWWIMENIGVTLGYIQVVICAVWYILTYLWHTLVHSGVHTMSACCLRLGNCRRRPWHRKSGHIVLCSAVLATLCSAVLWSHSVPFNCRY